MKHKLITGIKHIRIVEGKQTLGLTIAIIAMLVFSFSSHWNFIQKGTDFNEICCDSVKQMSHFFPALSEEFKKGNIFWSHEFGMGGDLFSSLSYYYTTSPFFLALLPFDISDFEDFSEARVWISIGKQFLMQLILFFFLRSLKRSILSSFLSAIIYVGSIYYIYYSIRYDFMIDGMLWLPLLLWGFERYRKKGFSKLFVLALFIVLSSNFYLAFMNSIFLGLYAIMAYFLYGENRSLKNFSFYMLKFFGLYLIGLGLAAMFFIPAILTFLQVDRFYYDIERPLFFTKEYYKHLPFEVFTMEDYGVQLTLPLISIVIFLLGLFIPNREVRIRMLFHLLFFIMALLPFFYSFYNGLSSQQNRWLYLLLLSHVIMVSFVLDNIKLLSSRFILSVVTGCLIGVYFLFAQKKELIGQAVSNFDIILLLSFLMGTIGILFILKNWRIKGMLILIMTTWYMSNQFQYSIINKLMPSGLVYSKEQQEIIKENYKNAEIKSILKYIHKDKGFYRISWDTAPYQNSSLLYNFNGFSSYNSLIAGNIHQFMKREVNILHQNTPSVIDGLDDRLYLETLLTSHYKIKLTNRIKNIPYGYFNAFQTKNYTVLKQKKPLPPAFTFKQAISKKSFNSLSFGQKDQVLLAAAVMDKPILPVYDIKNVNTTISFLKPEDANELINVSLQEDGLWSTMKPQNGTLIFNNPYYGKAGGEVLITLSFKEKNSQPFTLLVNQKKIQNFGDKYIYNYPREEFVFKTDTNQEKIMISFTPGQYEVKKIGAEFQPYKTFDSILNNQLKQSNTDINFGNNHLSINVRPKGKEILFVAVPYHKGWSATVDGEERKIQEIQSAFIGVPVSEGDKKVILSYRTPGLLPGMILGVFSLLIIVVIIIRKLKLSIIRK
jgi:uncharacterized membrane protein YfhO